MDLIDTEGGRSEACPGQSSPPPEAGLRLESRTGVKGNTMELGPRGVSGVILKPLVEFSLPVLSP